MSGRRLLCVYNASSRKNLPLLEKNFSATCTTEPQTTLLTRMYSLNANVGRNSARLLTTEQQLVQTFFFEKVGDRCQERLVSVLLQEHACIPQLISGIISLPLFWMPKGGLGGAEVQVQDKKQKHDSPKRT